MSYSTSSGTNDTRNLNQEAAHDTALYDPAVHDNQIVAMYETNEEATVARDALVKVGISAEAIEMISRSADSGALGGSNAEDRGSAFWKAVRSLFASGHEQEDYGHAVGRGHAMLVLTPSAEMDRRHAIHTLEATHPVDFDARLEEWRQAGYETANVDRSAESGQAPRQGQRERPAGSARVRSYVASKRTA